jgi:hypothetical protein
MLIQQLRYAKYQTGKEEYEYGSYNDITPLLLCEAFYSQPLHKLFHGATPFFSDFNQWIYQQGYKQKVSKNKPMQAAMKRKISFKKRKKCYGNQIKIDSSCGEYGHSMEIGNGFFLHVAITLKSRWQIYCLPSRTEILC